MAKRIITISREYGSGGRKIGRMVAESLGIAFYDKALIALVAEESGFSLEFVEETGEYDAGATFLSSIGSPFRRSIYVPENLSPSDKVHLVQSKVIRDIAEREPCVIVGRSAEYILRERDDMLSVFIHAAAPYKEARAVEEYDIAAKDVSKVLAKRDKTRANHYRRYTGQTWGVAQNYHLCLDSGAFGLERCCDFIVNVAKGI